MDFFDLDRGELVTLDQEDTLVNKGKQIDLVPGAVRRFFLRRPHQIAIAEVAEQTVI